LIDRSLIIIAFILLVSSAASAQAIFEDTFDSVSGATRRLSSTSKIVEVKSFTTRNDSFQNSAIANVGAAPPYLSSTVMNNSAIQTPEARQTGDHIPSPLSVAGGKSSNTAVQVQPPSQSRPPFSVTSDSYLNIVVPSGNGGSAGGVIYAPTEVRTSWAALAGATKRGAIAYTTLNGAFDFFVCPNNYERGDISWLRPIDISGISGPSGMRILLNGTPDNRVQFRIRTGAAHGLGSSPASFTTNDTFNLPNAIDRAPSLFIKGEIVHMGVTFATDQATGKVTIKLFGVQGIAPIETDSDTVGQGDLLAMQSFYISAAAAGAEPLTSGAWQFAVSSSRATNIDVDYDSIRLYSSAPDILPSLGQIYRLPPILRASFTTIPAGKDLSSTLFLERDTGIGLNATVFSSPASITLTWPAPDTGEGIWIGIYRKLPAEKAWKEMVASPELPITAVSWTDTSVKPGTMYEYKIKRRITAPNAPVGYGYCWAGIAVPPLHRRGSAVLVVESSVYAPLSAEIGTLVSDLNGDGWIVKQHTVDAKPVDTEGYAQAVVNVRKLIQADYQADPSVDAAILLGHVPVPYSGAVTLDGHDHHRGAWPADAYYGDITGTWTDASLTIKPDQSWNRNIPDDGKFDQNTLPAPVQLQVGRIDLSNLPAFTQPGETAAAAEVRLLRQYLNREHQWRQGQVKAERRGILTDFWLDGNGATSWGWVMSSSDGWRFLPTNVGQSNFSVFIPSGDWSADYKGERPGLLNSVLAHDDYLWAFGSTWGALDYANDVSNTQLLAKLGCRAVFMVLYASGIADWDTTNNLLRAHLAAVGLTLASMYSETPHVYMHPMGMGGTLGESMRLSMNNDITHTYEAGGWDITSTSNMALMGDPTLRQDMVAPPTSLRVAKNGGATLTWKASADAGASGFLGYYVYSAKAENTPYKLLTPKPIGATNWADTGARPRAVFMVRAATLHTGATGSYVNLSEGPSVGFAQ
jgi:hypothetical protein